MELKTRKHSDGSISVYANVLGQIIEENNIAIETVSVCNILRGHKQKLVSLSSLNPDDKIYIMDTIRDRTVFLDWDKIIISDR